MQHTSMYTVGGMPVIDSFSISRGGEFGWSKYSDAIATTGDTTPYHLKDVATVTPIQRDPYKPSVVTTKEWTTALEHSEIALVLLADTKGTPFYPLSSIVPDHYVMHKLQTTSFGAGNLMTIDNVGYVCKDYWKTNQGYTTPYGYTVTTLFVHAPTDKSLRKVLKQIDKLLPRPEHPYEGRDAITIFGCQRLDTIVNHHDIIRDTLTSASIVWYVIQ